MEGVSYSIIQLFMNMYLKTETINMSRIHVNKELEKVKVNSG
jgi:hypothetical protein